MNNEIEDIVDLFDEFFIIDSPEQANIVKPVVVAAAEKPVVEPDHAEPVSKTPENPLPPVTSVPPAPQVTISPLNFSGANKRHITVIYNDKNNDSRANVEMLSNLITKALKFSMDDVAIVRLSRNPEHTLKTIADTLQPEYIMAWGASGLVKDAQLQTPVHGIVAFGGAQVLLADEVHAYLDNNVHKTALWQAIQTLFAK